MLSLTGETLDASALPEPTLLSRLAAHLTIVPVDSGFVVGREIFHASKPYGNLLDRRSREHGDENANE